MLPSPRRCSVAFHISTVGNSASSSRTLPDPSSACAMSLITVGGSAGTGYVHSNGASAQGSGFCPYSFTCRTPAFNSLSWAALTPVGQLLWPSSYLSLATNLTLILSPALTFVPFSGVECSSLNFGGSRSLSPLSSPYVASTASTEPRLDETSN